VNCWDNPKNKDKRPKNWKQRTDNNNSQDGSDDDGEAGNISTELGMMVVNYSKDPDTSYETAVEEAEQEIDSEPLGDLFECRSETQEPSQ
jgi:hypothetical protein